MRKSLAKPKKRPKAKEDKNPFGYTPEGLRKMLKQKKIYVGPPPYDDPNRKFTSPCWENGMRFLYYTEDDEEVVHWYICGKCKRFFNCLLGGGTGAVGKHPNTHLKQKRYILDRSALALALSRATSLGNYYGHVSEHDFEKIMPPAEEW